MGKNFEQYRKNWNESNLEEEMKSLISQKKQSKKNNAGNSISEAILFFELSSSDLEDLKNNLSTDLECRFYLGAKIDSKGNKFFSPHLGLFSTSKQKILIELDLLQNEEFTINENSSKGINKLKQPIKQSTLSQPISKDYAKNLMHNWNSIDNSNLSMHFNVRMDSKLKETEKVKFYRFDLFKNLTNSFPNRINELMKLRFGLGINLERVNSDLPSFTPILNYQFNNSGVNQSSAKGPQGGSGPQGDDYYEDLADPCPPLC